MLVSGNIDTIRKNIDMQKRKGAVIGFVPTMGALHEGHLSLIRRSNAKCGFTVASIFVNPIQFGPKEDYGKYPRTLSRDRKLLEKEGCAVLFTPTAQTMYRERLTTVHVSDITEILCGRTRPGHFDGVTTVVNKLFNIVNPDYAFFGEKDYQQLAVIKKMTEDLNMNVKIIGCPIIREADGLAMSSRNRYLSSEDRQNAPAIHNMLKKCAAMLKQGKSAGAVKRHAVSGINKIKNMNAEYIEILSNELLKPDAGARRLRIFAAVKLSNTRLIDNVEVRL